jgi:hypothetical protein
VREPNCEKCRKGPRECRLTRHHVLPKRFFGSSDTAPVVLLCRSCHDQVEEMIPLKEQRGIQFYWAVLFLFLESERVLVHEWRGARRYYVSVRQMQEALV